MGGPGNPAALYSDSSSAFAGYLPLFGVPSTLKASSSPWPPIPEPGAELAAHCPGPLELSFRSAISCLHVWGSLMFEQGDT